MEGICYILTISKTASNYLSTLSFFFILLLKTGRGELNTTKSTVFFVKWCKTPMSQLIQRGSCWLYQFVIYKRSISAWSARMNGERECRKREGSQMMGIGRMCKKNNNSDHIKRCPVSHQNIAVGSYSRWEVLGIGIVRQCWEGKTAILGCEGSRHSVWGEAHSLGGKTPVACQREGW